ncbi:protein misato homolog 1 [Chiroxiphia lanceolata]|uniref:protein misato homolog 1 n=1 Tax=Chiroxiphia lanceolata TaxID=296741 RepID=UPI0013CE6244|nr:protein misato homolog 1 [Chiroxiphia lanceolata]
MPGEAVTLQLGHYSGCVGAHWWGLQAAALRGPAEPAELRAAALLRPGRGPGGTETPSPRLVALELKGGVGALRPEGVSAEAPVPWDGAVADYRDAPRDSGNRAGDAACDGKGGPGAAVPGAAPPGSQDPPSVRLWSDYLNVPLHPRSVHVIRQFLHDGDCGCLEAFAQGESLLQDPACVEELEDRLHFFVEECDYLQGFQVLCDLHNGFSGVGAKVTELLHDEYSGKGILSWGLTPATSDVGDPQSSFYRLLNTALGIVHLSQHSSLFCPLSLSGSLGIRPRPPVTFPYIKYDASLNYHSSAILAAALDTLTVPYRLWSSQGSMVHFADSLTFSGRKVVAAWASLPFPAFAGSSLPEILSAHQQDVPWKLLLSSWREQKVSCCFAQSVVLRGVCKERPSSSSLGQQPRTPLQGCESPEEMLQHYLHTHFPGSFSTAHVLQQPCDTRPPFPQFFSPLLTRQGFLQDKALGHSSAGPNRAVQSIPVLAALQASPVLHQLLSGLWRDLRARNVRRWSSFFTAGLEQDDFQQALEELKTLSQCYETGFGGDGSEDEADSD